MAEKTTKKASGANVARSKKPSKPVAAKSAKAVKTAKVPDRTPGAAAEVAKGVALSRKEKEAIEARLLRLRDQVSGHISFLADDSLSRVDDTPADDRTDDFDREFALNLVSSEHDSLFEIDEALRRLREGSYGMCEMCQQRIEKARLTALPFAKMCVRCQSQSERGRTKFRPFGATLYQAAEQPGKPASAEEAE